MNFDEELYKKKYLKYKSKYLELRGSGLFGSVQELLDPTKIIKEERDLICNAPNYVFDGCNEKLKEHKLDSKLNKDQKKAELEKIKHGMLNNKQATIKYPNGIIYIGPLTDGVPHNNAILKYPNGDKYYGYIKNLNTNLIPDGRGTLYNTHNTILYQGTFIDGQPKGKQSLELPSKIDSKTTVKINYHGEVLNEKPHGHGKLTYYDGKTYTGYFENGKRHGSGKLESYESTYEGQWEDDKRNGFGVLTYNKTGNKWEGEWYNNKQYSGKKILSEDDEY